MIEATRRGMNTNFWWAGQLADVGVKPVAVEETLNTIPDLESVTPARVRNSRVSTLRRSAHGARPSSLSLSPQRLRAKPDGLGAEPPTIILLK